LDRLHVDTDTVGLALILIQIRRLLLIQTVERANLFMSWYENVLGHFEMVVGHILDIVDVLSCWRLLRNRPLVFCLELSGL
jgi:hypothetical protein